MSAIRTPSAASAPASATYVVTRTATLTTYSYLDASGRSRKAAYSRHLEANGVAKMAALGLVPAAEAAAPAPAVKAPVAAAAPRSYAELVADRTADIAAAKPMAPATPKATTATCPICRKAVAVAEAKAGCCSEECSAKLVAAALATFAPPAPVDETAAVEAELMAEAYASFAAKEGRTAREDAEVNAWMSSGAEYAAYLAANPAPVSAAVKALCDAYELSHPTTKAAKEAPVAAPAAAPVAASARQLAAKAAAAKVAEAVTELGRAKVCSLTGGNGLEGMAAELARLADRLTAYAASGLAAPAATPIAAAAPAAAAPAVSVPVFSAPVAASPVATSAALIPLVAATVEAPKSAPAKAATVEETKREAKAAAPAKAATLANGDLDLAALAEALPVEAPAATPAPAAALSLSVEVDAMVPATPRTYRELLSLGKAGVERLARAADIEPKAPRYAGRGGWSKLCSDVWAVAKAS